jgi:hypothetical protein
MNTFKSFLFIVSLVVLTVFSTSCGKNKEELAADAKRVSDSTAMANEREDAIAKADSLASIVKIGQDSLKAITKRDSIAKVAANDTTGSSAATGATTVTVINQNQASTVGGTTPTTATQTPGATPAPTTAQPAPTVGQPAPAPQQPTVQQPIQWTTNPPAQVATVGAKPRVLTKKGLQAKMEAERAAGRSTLSDSAISAAVKYSGLPK